MRARARGWTYEGETAEARRKARSEPWRARIPLETRLEVFARDRWRCKICNRTSHEAPLEVDHIIPLSRGGTDDKDSLQALCRDCNLDKSDTLPGDI